MSRIALGTAQFGLPYGIANKDGQVALPQVKAMLQLASANGIDTLDTASAYGDSEYCLGVVGTLNFKLITKLPVMPQDCGDVSEWVRQQVIASLSRLRVTTVYGLLLHWPGQLLSPNGTALYKALCELKDIGLVRKVGVSIYSPSELEALTSQFVFDLVQAPFNLVDRRLHTTGWLQRLKDDGVEIHTRSAFLQGLLLMNQSDIPSKFSPWGSLWKSWHGWLADQEGTAVQACLNFPLSFTEIDRVIVGADSISQLAQILSAASSQLLGELPDLQCEDEDLTNPAKWPVL